MALENSNQTKVERQQRQVWRQEQARLLSGGQRQSAGGREAEGVSIACTELVTVMVYRV